MAVSIFMREKKYKISIIIPAYNEEKFLPLCLESISNLDWPKEQLEVIVVDNGSIDKTVEIANSYNTVVLKNDNKNVSGLRNLGAEHAKGDILAFVDADCIVNTNWLKQAQVYFSQKDIAAWGGPPDIPDQSTWVQRGWYLLRQKTEKVEPVDWLESMNLFTRKETFLLAGGFDESLITCEDVDFSYRISGHGKIIADQSIKVQHLGEADTLKVFIKKELWRGKGNYSGLFKHGIKIKEIPSLAMPIYFGLLLPTVFIIMVVKFSLGSLFLVSLAALLPGMLTLFKVRKKKAGIIQRFQLLFLSYIYFMVRTIAVLPISND